MNGPYGCLVGWFDVQRFKCRIGRFIGIQDGWMEKLACWLDAKLIVLATNWFDIRHVVCIAG